MLLTSVQVCFERVLKIRLFEGSDLVDGKRDTSQSLNRSRENKKYVELAMKDVLCEVLAYSSVNNDDSNTDHSAPEIPLDRIFVHVGEWLVTFGGVNQRQKLLGLWRTPSHSRDSAQPAITLTLLGFGNRSMHVKEYRLHVSMLPVRCHLTSEMLEFFKALVTQHAPTESLHETTSADESSSPPGLFFQLIDFQPVRLKIDYHASHVSLRALRDGDFTQLLNILPIDGLELNLRHLKLKGVAGGAVGKRLGEAWVQDIYSTQLHRLLSGTAPLKGLVNIGADLHSLLFLPSTKTSTKNNQDSYSTLKQLTVRSTALARTLARESLDLSHRVTRFVASSITNLASDASVSDDPALRSQPSDVADGLRQAYSLICNEVSSAARTVVSVPIRQYERNGSSGVITEVIRILPVAILKPLGGVAHGLSYTILGLRNTIDPNSKTNDEDIYNVEFDDGHG